MAITCAAFHCIASVRTTPLFVQSCFTDEFKRAGKTYGVRRWHPCHQRLEQNEPLESLRCPEAISQPPIFFVTPQSHINLASYKDVKHTALPLAVAGKLLDSKFQIPSEPRGKLMRLCVKSSCPTVP
ncbi:MAG: hypothetical protein N3B10_04200 [Armatimonadetes bacterium]|nr:hypothetical protein [Armatimonadota bacterium]MCX7967679.1 hypothetical protein [Armatimonadota bacterium]MDW8142672.1 hypothetical protein [Armatimonadota bacterium]